jgi:SAM-dependent methyltransferase
MWLLLAFAEGAACLVLEIAGARALAPYFGTSQVVWTAQITATLACLACGYALGGHLAKTRAYVRLEQLLLASALWLAASSFVRAPAFQSVSGLGIAVGSLLAALLVFGLPLVALGAMSPLLVERFGRKRSGAITGRVLFASTVGGLVGGWFAALFSLSRLGVRITLALVAIVLGLLAIGWAKAALGEWRWRASLALAGISTLAFLSPAPAREVGPADARGRVVWSKQGATGLVQVLDVPAIDGRFLLVDGTVQGAERRSTHRSLVEFSEYLEVGARWARPEPKRVLVVGLGAGTLAATFARAGVETVALEIDPEVVEAARTHFDLPGEVQVIVGDAREYLRSEHRRFDAVLLDVYRGESFPWHLGTKEAFSEMRALLEPGGCVALNGIVSRNGESPGFLRLEAVARDTFQNAVVFHGGGDAELVNATLVASDTVLDPRTAEEITKQPHFATFRDAHRDAVVPTDDRSDFDQADGELRVAWRKSLLGELDPAALLD